MKEYKTKHGVVRLDDADAEMLGTRGFVIKSCLNSHREPRIYASLTSADGSKRAYPLGMLLLDVPKGGGVGVYHLDKDGFNFQRDNLWVGARWEFEFIIMKVVEETPYE